MNSKDVNVKKIEPYCNIATINGKKIVFANIEYQRQLPPQEIILDKVKYIRADLTDAQKRTCRFNVIFDLVHGMKDRADICACDNCGYQCAYGFIVDERFKYCPNCGMLITQKHN